ncbi:EAL domain-containing protein [Gordonia sp. L191]|uniref:EAL domain-containing protein n=1 Tax=Gordonia sp. L191 TaxID=2982699 RepID=UPI0024C03849|nr:EAL domain-containing protein [Gordonia sp. L191]WHU45881.1 EAL domain-containing protein [Gordonia sp. L191]
MTTFRSGCESGSSDIQLVQPGWGVVVALSIDPYHRVAVAYGRERSVDIAEAFIASALARSGATAALVRRSDLEWIGSFGSQDVAALSLLDQPWSFGAHAVDLDGVVHYLDLAMGIVRAADFPVTVADEEIVSAADAALSRALVDGLSAVIANPSLAQSLQREIAVANALITADDDDFPVYYQPIVRLSDDVTVGWESLLRWTTAGSVRSPDAFMPVAEATSLIIPIGRRAIRAVFADLAGRIGRTEGDEAFISINLSAKQLWDESLPAYFAELGAEYGVEPSRVWIEVSEIDVIRPAGAAARTLFALHDLGCTICVDDLGSGFSALRYVRDLPVEVLKVDRTLVTPLPDSASDRAVVDAICTMAKATGLRVVAEGIETQDELDEVTKLCFDLGQGYLLGRPAAAADLFGPAR